MAIIKTKRNWPNLIATLNRGKHHFESANETLRNGIDIFCNKLQTENIAYANINPSGTVWGYKSLIKCFCEIFDPILLIIFPHGSSIQKLQQPNKIPLPLAKFLVKKQSCKELANLIKNAINDLERLIPIPDKRIKIKKLDIDDRKIIEDAENLELLAYMLLAISNELDTKYELTWCSICFRRAAYNSPFCYLHSATNDTNYRKGKRIKEAIINSEYKIFLRNRSQRKALGDNFRPLPTSSDISKRVAHDLNGIDINPTISQLILDTINKKWDEICEDWNQLLKTMPNVANEFSQNASNFNNWDEYSEALVMSLENPFENTKHHYWFILMLIEAEIWLSHEQKFNDRRLSDNEEKILKLISKGYNNSEIALKIGVSRQYVGKIKKLNN